MPPTRSKTERPREPLLQARIGHVHMVRRIGGRLRSRRSGVGGAIGEIPPSVSVWPNPDSREAGRGTVRAG